MGNDSHLNRRRYAQNDETLYVAPEDDRTDYVRSSNPEWPELLLISLHAVAAPDDQLVSRGT